MSRFLLAHFTMSILAANLFAQSLAPSASGNSPIPSKSSAISFTVGHSYRYRPDQFFGRGGFAGSDHALEKQFHKSGCDYRDGIEPRDY